MFFPARPNNVLGASWYNYNWNYSIKIVIDSSDVDEILTDFPVLVYLNSSRVTWSRIQDGLDDLRFTNPTNTTLYRHEIENYVVNDEAWLWVKIPLISNTTDTIFYMYYDNVGASTVENPEDVWDSNFVLVYHMVDNSTSTMLDSTLNSNDGTKKAVNEPIETLSGRIDSAQDFQINDNEKIEILSSSSLNNLNVSFTVEAHINPDNVVGRAIFEKSVGGVVNTHFMLGLSGSKVFFRIDKGGLNDLSSDDAVTVGDWSYIGGTWNGSLMRTFINGSFQVTTKALVSPCDSGAGISRIGLLMNDAWDYGGIIDELRISDVARSDAWIKTSYESSRDDLLSFGSEVFRDYLLTLDVEEGLTVYLNGSVVSDGEVTPIASGVYYNVTSVEANGWDFDKYYNGSHILFVNPLIDDMAQDLTIRCYSSYDEGEYVDIYVVFAICVFSIALGLFGFLMKKSVVSLLGLGVALISIVPIPITSPSYFLGFQVITVLISAVCSLLAYDKS